jgi:perosamine synthetase
MTNLQAAVGVAQMEQIETFIAHKQHIAKEYARGLAGLTTITLPPQASWASSVYWMYSILLNENAPLRRDELMAGLKAHNIDSRPFFYPIHQMPPYQETQGNFPVAEELSRRGVNLPSGNTLTDEDIERVCTTLKELLD